jgi:uncharacterized protein (TIGR02145 family)
MKKAFWIKQVLFVAILLIFTACCKKDKMPIVTTSPVSCVTRTTAQSGGSITSNGGAGIIEKGVCWNTQGNPTVLNDKTNEGSGSEPFLSSIAGLSMNTTYYLRAYATNSSGTSYGSQESFTTAIIIFNPSSAYGSVTDIEGNVYKTIQIGSQTWMAENLRTTSYNNGDLIGTTSPATLDISGETDAKYQWAYDGNECSVDIFGRLYTFYAITDARGVCPTGWHVPGYEEWVILVSPYGTGGIDFHGAELMESETTHWNRTDITGTNETGFTALPGGYRLQNGTFKGMTSSGEYWTSTTYWQFSMPPLYVPIPWSPNYGITPSSTFEVEQDGLSVRCIKDSI